VKGKGGREGGREERLTRKHELLLFGRCDGTHLSPIRYEREIMVLLVCMWSKLRI